MNRVWSLLEVCARAYYIKHSQQQRINIFHFSSTTHNPLLQARRLAIAEAVIRRQLSSTTLRSRAWLRR